MKKSSKNVFKVKPCKKIITFNPQTKKPNGWLLEVISDTDNFTKHLKGQVYMLTANSGEFKGYHLHAGADYFVTCLKGKVRHIIYKNINQKEVIDMGDDNFKTVFLPKGHPHAIENIGADLAYVLVYRYPAWSANIKEQFDILKDEIEKPESWKKIRSFIKKFNASVK